MILPETPKLTLEPPTPGLHLNVPAETYFAWRAVSAGLLKVAHAETMAHARAYMTNPTDSTDALRFGSAAHCYYFEPERFKAEYVTWAGRRDMRNAEYAALVEAHGEDRILKLDEAAQLADMLAAIREESMGRRLLRYRGHIECCIVWTDEATGLVCKARADKLIRGVKFPTGWNGTAFTGPVVPTSCIIDLKTTTNANPEDFARDAAKYGYDITAAHYCNGAEVVLGEAARYFLLAQEKDAPYLSCLYDCSHEKHEPKAVEVGRVKVAEAMQRLATALTTNDWPGYPDDFQPLRLPAWACVEESV